MELGKLKKLLRLNCSFDDNKRVIGVKILKQDKSIWKPPGGKTLYLYEKVENNNYSFRISSVAVFDLNHYNLYLYGSEQTELSNKISYTNFDSKEHYEFVKNILMNFTSKWEISYANHL